MVDPGANEIFPGLAVPQPMQSAAVMSTAKHDAPVRLARAVTSSRKPAGMAGRVPRGTRRR